MKQFQTNKSNFADTRIVETQSRDLEQNEVRAKVDAFSFTANNITYAAVGEQIGYWQFFPAAQDPDNTWGIIPVWGFATVEESLHSDIKQGERLFGYFPPSSNVVLKPSKVSELSFIDGADHRSQLPAGYNLYRRVPAVESSNKLADQERMLLYPLFVTAFCLHDMLQDKNWFGAQQVVIGSASSKTSIGLAYALAEDDSAPKIVALTSDRNRESVENLGIYDEIAVYDSLESIDASVPTTIVDMSANGEIMGRLHQHLGDNLKFCSNVGLTHWESAKPGPGYNAERSQMFFAPGHIAQRIQDWGADGFEAKSSAFIMRTALKSRDWLSMREIDGLTGLQDIYDDVCHGRIAPNEGLIVNV